jgi:hypothetical protein
MEIFGRLKRGQSGELDLDRGAISLTAAIESTGDH